jgi:hypothetical protein
LAPGARIGGLVAAGAHTLPVLVLTVVRAAYGELDWSVPGALALLVAATALLVRPARRRSVALLGSLTVLVDATVLLLARGDVTVLEAYTLPCASVALLAGILARRAGSWVTYGPALVVALAPSLISILANDGQQLRRLLLGVAALVIVLAGVRFGLRALVLLGGGTLAVVALHELTPVWDLVPRWIPLAAAGLLLVLLAMTLERRRRDLARFRSALHRMS